jgi:hypothetical protein
MTRVIVMFDARGSYFLDALRLNHGWAGWIVQRVDNLMEIWWPHNQELGSAFTTATQQRHHQDESAVPSPHFQHRLSSAITIWLGSTIAIAIWLGSAITSMTWSSNLIQRFTTDQALWLEEYFSDDWSDPRAKCLFLQPMILLGGSMSTTPTNSPTQVHCYLHH